MTDESTKKAVLRDVPTNTSRASVDGITLVKGDTEGKDLTEDQVNRLKAAGVKLAVEGDDGPDPIDSIRTHEQADAALKEADVTVTADTDLEGKKQALRDAQDD